METIEVILKNHTDGDRVPVSTQAQPGGTSAGTQANDRNTAASRDKGVLAAGLVAVQQIMPYVDTAISFTSTQIGYSSGSADLQNRVQILAGAASSGAQILMGAAVAGPAGAAVMLATQVVQSAVSYASNHMEISNQKRIEFESVALRRSRLGQSVNRSRTGGVS